MPGFAYAQPTKETVLSRSRITRLFAGALVTAALSTTSVALTQTAAYAVAQCSDGLDNDRDGNTDYPADPGCASAADTTEGVGCVTSNPDLGIVVCAGISATDTIQRVHVYSYNVVPGTEHTAAGYVDLYRFVLPGGTIVNLPCVVLLQDSSVVNPCDDAGGTFVSRTSTLLDESVFEPVVVQGPELASVGVCNGELMATVNDIGIASARAYTLC